MKIKNEDTNNNFIRKIDCAIGDRVYSLRLAYGLSRQDLAEKIGVTHQQLQKYEKGINKISTGRLILLAGALNVPLSHFYEGLENMNEASIANSNLEDPLPKQHQRLCLEVARNFMKISNPEHQIAVSSLVKSLTKIGTFKPAVQDNLPLKALLDQNSFNQDLEPLKLRQEGF